MTHTSPSVARGAVRPVPRWAVVAAWATVWCVVPSSVWRVAAGLGVDVGFTGELGQMYRGPAFLSYVWVLTVVSQAAALLTLGLVRPWGERVPSWIPRLRGRPIPPLVVITPALLGGIAVTALSAMLGLAPNGPLDNPNFPRGAAGVIMAVCYAPLLAWGPLVIALTVAYARRRGVLNTSNDRHADAGAARTITGPSRRARWAAHTAALVAVPSGVWRIGLALGFPLGYTEQGHRDLVGSTGWGPAYLIGLSLLTEAAALLTLGLVQRWGETVPRWIPLIGGRSVPPLAAVVPAWIGVVALAVLWTPFLSWWAVPHDGMTAAGHTLVGLLYLPLVAWAPLLAAVTISYQRRRRLPVNHDTRHATHASASAPQPSLARNG